MDDPAIVRRLQRVRNLPRNRQHLVWRQRARRQSIGERRPLRQLEHERLHAIVLLDAIQRRDIRMRE